MTELIRKSSLWVVILFLSQRILLLICMVMQFMWTTNKNFLLPRKYLKKTLWILTIFDWLYFIQCLTFFSSINHFLCLFCSAFDAISSNINGVLSVNPSAKMFVFGYFNIHHKDCLTYSGRTEWPGALCYNFSISNDHTQMVNFHNWVPDCDSHSPTLLGLFLFSTMAFCSTMASLQWEILIMLLFQFPLNFCQTQNGMHCFIT